MYGRTLRPMRCRQGVPKSTSDFERFLLPQAVEERRIRPCALYLVEKAMAGNDREPIGRKGKPSRPAKEKVSRRRVREEEYDDDYEDDYEDEEPMPRKGKGKGRKPRGKRGWFWLLLKLFIVFVVLIAIYGVYLDQKIRSRIDGKVWQLPAAVYGRMVNLEPDM